MNHFKKSNNKLEKLRGIFFQIGLIIAGGLTLLAFEWMTPINPYDLPSIGVIYEEEWELPPIIPEKEVVQPEVKKTPKEINKEIIEIVKELPKEKPEEKKEKKKKELEFDPDKWKVKEKVKKEKTFFNAGIMPHYDDCKSLNETERKKCTQEKMYEHFGNIIKVPMSIKLRGKADYKAFVYFEVNKKGKVVNVKILNDEKNKIPKELAREAYNAVNSLPAMNPGKNHGKKVTVGYMVPINFTIR